MSVEMAVKAPPARNGSTSLGELVHFVDRQTLHQVQDLSIRQSEGALVVTGRSRTYYAKQLVTQSILLALPAVRIVNDVSVS